MELWKQKSWNYFIYSTILHYKLQLLQNAQNFKTSAYENKKASI